jgi:16S rRNA (uracil1498-N3)-methyltransferase
VKQCGRSVLPEVTDVLSFNDAMVHMKAHEHVIVCWEEEKQTSLKETLQGDFSDIGIVIGPEGGFETAEVEKIRDLGGVSATLGPRILRTETAGIVVLSVVFYDKGQMQY